MSSTLPPQALDRELVLEFFWTFSVLECALKRAGFIKPGRDNAAEPDWKRFGREVQGRFADVTVPGFLKAVEELTRLAPKRQVFRNGELGWDPVVRGKSESSESYTVRLLKTSRNNLFHGGKYPDGPIDEISRDRRILRAALTTLNGFHEIHSEVKRWIDN